MDGGETSVSETSEHGVSTFPAIGTAFLCVCSPAQAQALTGYPRNHAQ
jgi:hypothetical protein